MNNTNQSASWRTKIKILVVEDEQYMRELYTEILAEQGYSVESADNGEKAYEMITQGKFDLILLDLVMPTLSGIDVVRKLRDKYPANVGFPKIVVLTNLGELSTIAEVVSQGVRGYIIKSDVTPDKFLSEVKSYLDEK